MDKTTVVTSVVARFKRAVEQCAPAQQEQEQQAAVTRPTPVGPQAGMEQQAVSPPGWEKTVEHMKDHKEIDNPFALAWYMKNKGAEPHHASTPKFLLAANAAFKRHTAKRK
jgi:hypothetical protein